MKGKKAAVLSVVVLLVLLSLLTLQTAVADTELPNYSITVEKEINSGGYEQMFDFEINFDTAGIPNAFQLGDDDKHTEVDLQSGQSYSIVETVPEGWNDPEIDCVSLLNEGSSSEFYYGTNSVTVLLADRDIIHCLFTNTPEEPPPAAPPPVVPEASTLILLGGAATSLAGYVGLQIRARRRR
jgi:hypothetical protein